MQRHSFDTNPGFYPGSCGLSAAILEQAERLDAKRFQHRSMGHQS
jgi:hypothetical protein